MTLIIDCHGHYTTAPSLHVAWRDAQVSAWKSGSVAPAYPAITDNQICDTIETNQLKLLRERGADMTIFSPRASTMAPHIGDQAIARAWGSASNDLIARVCGLYPEHLSMRSLFPTRNAMRYSKAMRAGSIPDWTGRWPHVGYEVRPQVCAESAPTFEVF